MNWEHEAEFIVNWLRDKVSAANAKGLVIGLSGGIDSSVVAALSKRAFPDNVVGVIMPCQSNPQDAEHGQLVAKTFNIPVHVVDLCDTYNSFISTVSATDGQEVVQLTKANVKPRLRMTTLYYFAGANNYLVVGTGNRSELEIGYFTKYG
ncbi:MAG: NAD(+) synthase, partial [Bacillota bacterium]|nr:NAD(+) synthase [Bacillota bacterium]